MLGSRGEAARVARKWGVEVDDVVLIALNACGLRADTGVSRLRFRFHLDSRPDTQLHMILSLNRVNSPFELVGDEILLGGERIALIDAADADDAVLGYWRNGRKVLTLNSNARSQCTGCVFCPNTLETASDPRLAAADDLHSCLAAIAAEADLADLSGVDTVTVCTGCFHHEHLALQHLAQVREAMTGQGCTGDIHFLSSVLTTPGGLDAAHRIGPFHLTLTVECFTRRGVVLKESKAKLTAAGMVRVLDDAVARGLATDFTYIVGLDPVEEALPRLADLVPVTTTFPRFQVYQTHNSLMDVFLAPGAGGVEFHLRMRRELEDLFGPTGLRPRPWENYRPLWYFDFAGEPLEGARV